MRNRRTRRTPTAQPMRTIDLREYVTSEPYLLSVEERDELRKVPSLTIEPAPGEDSAYCLTPGSTIGALEIGDLSVSIFPKLDISRVLFLASYAMGAFKLQDMKDFNFEDAPLLVEALSLAFTAAAHRAFASGLLHGYRTEEEAMHTVRGRVRITEQIRRRFGVPLPLEVRYDEFTDDIMANRLVKAATARLGRMRVRSRQSRTGLRWVSARLENVSLVEFPTNAVPKVAFDRLNAHYREVVALSRLILQHTSFEIGRGDNRAPGFLMDMNVVFQGFVTQALREALGVSDRTFHSDTGPHRITLDQAGRVLLKPDLSWWDGSTCTFVGDAKYKRINDERVPNADLYQLLAYATALDLPGGLLVYAQGEAEQLVQVRYAGKRLEVAALDLSGTIDELLTGIDELANRVCTLRHEAYRTDRAA